MRMAAEVARAAGTAVDLYDAMGSVGRKFLLAGKGGLNLTHGEPRARFVERYGARHDEVGRWLDAFDADALKSDGKSSLPSAQSLIEPLSQRELEVLRLIAHGLSNDEISKRLFLALDTVKGHNRRIYDKLQVQRRTEAVARARELGLL